MGKYGWAGRSTSKPRQHQTDITLTTTHGYQQPYIMLVKKTHDHMYIQTNSHTLTNQSPLTSFGCFCLFVLCVGSSHSLDIGFVDGVMVHDGAGVVTADDTASCLLHTAWCFPRLIDVLCWELAQLGQVFPVSVMQQVYAITTNHNSRFPSVIYL